MVDKICLLLSLCSCGCNNIISSSTTNVKQLESFFCQFWPELCENSLLCDRNNNSLSSHPPEEEEQNSNSLSSSSLMLILPENRPDSHSRAKLSRTVTPLKSPGLVLSLMRRWVWQCGSTENYIMFSASEGLTPILGREEAVKTTFTLTCLHCRGGGKGVRQ